MMQQNKLGFGGILGVVILLLSQSVSAQTCTLDISGSINWDNSTAYACEDGVNFNDATIIVIPSDLTVTFNNNGDTWVGTRIETHGTLRITAPGQVTISSDIFVKSGGLVSIDGKLNVGSGSDPECDKMLIIEEGGLVDIISGTPDRLNICGEEIARGGTAGCNDYPEGNLPYCEPSGGFSGPVAFDKGGVNNSLLPVILQFFVAKTFENSILLTWQTASELNNDYFTLERSKDGINYNAFATIQGYGTTNEPQHYEFADTHPFSGLSYYRLKQTDFDGTTETFRPVSVVIEGTNSSAMVYPNPLKNNELYVDLMSTTFNEEVRLSIFNISGARVFEGLVNAQNTPGISKFDMGFLPKGAYVVNLNNKNINQNLKLIRE